MPEQSKKRNPVFAIFSSLYNATTLFGPLFAYVLFTNVIQAVMLPISLLLPRKTVITFNSWIVGTVAIFFQHVFENVAKAKIVYYGDELPHRENAIMFANHLSFTDFMFLNGLANKKQMIHHLKYFAKDSLRYMPGFGWLAVQAGFIMVKRNWMQDSTAIKQSFEHLNETRVPIWIVSFLEGSRSNKKKILESQAFAQKNNLPVLKHVMLPRTRGFLNTVNSLYNKENPYVEYVYDVTIGYGKQGIPTLLQIFTNPDILKDRTFHVHIKRFKLADLPMGDEKALSQWVVERFVEKDNILEYLEQNDKFPGEPITQGRTGFDTTLVYFMQAISIGFWSVLSFFALRYFGKI